jgi:hypothetical protein
VLGIIALVPSPVTQSFASTSNNLTITGNGDTALMELKATKQNGRTNTVSDFEIGADNVLFIEEGDSVTITDNVRFTKAQTIDSNDKKNKIAISSNGQISFAGYAQGTYVLDVIVDGDKAYEAIIVIGDEDEETVNKQITKVNTKTFIDIWIVTIFEVLEEPEPSYMLL